MAFVDLDLDHGLSGDEYMKKIEEVEDRWQGLVLVASAMLQALAGNRYTQQLCEDIDKFLSDIGVELSAVAYLKNTIAPHERVPALTELADKTYEFCNTWAQLKEVAEQLTAPEEIADE